MNRKIKEIVGIVGVTSLITLIILLTSRSFKDAPSVTAIKTTTSTQSFQMTEELVRVTFYSSLDDGPEYGKVSFTGRPLIPYQTIAIDPSFWSTKFNLSYDPKAKQTERARAPVFTQLIFVDVENGRTYTAVDIGGLVKASTIDIFCGFDKKAQDEARKMGINYRKILVIYRGPQ